MTPRAAVSNVAATEAAASATSLSTSGARPSGRCRAITEWNRKNSWCCRSVSELIDGSSLATSASCCRRTTAGGWARAAERWGQLSGQSISTNRWVPQHTGQMDVRSAGQSRRALRCSHRGQSIGPSLFDRIQNFSRRTYAESARRPARRRFVVNLSIFQHIRKNRGSQRAVTAVVIGKTSETGLIADVSAQRPQHNRHSMVGVSASSYGDVGHSNPSLPVGRLNAGRRVLRF